MSAAEEAGEWIQRLAGVLRARQELKPTPEDQMKQVYGMPVRKHLKPPVAVTPAKLASKLSDKDRDELVRLLGIMLDLEGG
ncbi:MAG TPA: hypothetical protein VG848_00105 [Acetobacteraceae bacterium]|nr:hypothetical protein [Acetobacteraceae bacterium]